MHDAPILDHPVDDAAAFTAEALIDDVRRLRNVSNAPLPAVCFLEFDGDLTDWLVERRNRSTVQVLGMLSHHHVFAGA